MSGTKYPNQGELFYGIVVGGDSEDPAPDKAGGFRVHIPGQYGPNVLKEHLPFIRMLGEGTQNGMTRFNPPPERGSAVMAMKMGGHAGTGHMVVLGTLPNDIMKNMGVPGGKSLNQLFDDAINHITNKKGPPKSLKNSTRDGAQVRQVTDDKMWSHSLVKHIPSTGTVWPMSGIFLPEVSNVTTAIQHFSGILNEAMLSGLPGTTMSLGSMFGLLQSTGAFDQILNQLPDEMVGAMESMSNLITTVEMSESAGFTVGGRVDQDTFLTNAADLLSQVRSIGDIVDVLQQLQFDTSLYGQEKLSESVYVANTAFGQQELIIHYTGRVRSNVNVHSVIATANANTTNTTSGSSSGGGGGGGNDFAQNILSFVSTMLSSTSSMSMSGENLFGDSAKQKFDMYNRMNPGALSTAKSLIETLSTGDKEASHHRLVATLVRDGGKLLSGRGFKQ